MPRHPLVAKSRSWPMILEEIFLQTGHCLSLFTLSGHSNRCHLRKCPSAEEGRLSMECTPHPSFFWSAP